MVDQGSLAGLASRRRSSAQLPPTSPSPLSPTLSSPRSLSSYRSSGSGSDTVTAMSPVVQPIAINSSSSTFAPPRPLPPVFGSSTSSGATPLSAPLDGPLHDLLPALSLSAGASSSDDSSLASRSLVSTGRPPSAGPGRRVVSAGLSAYVSSPSRSSPLSKSWDDLSADEAPWFTRPPPFGLPISLPSSPDFGSPTLRRLPPLFGIPSSPPSPHASTPLTASRRRRRSSISLSSSIGSSAPPFGSLVGSFENSLLSGRMSALPSLPLPFVASIGVLGSPDSPARLRCPQHLHVPFSAVFYSGLGEVNAASPYVGTVDLDAHYHSLLQPAPPSSDKKEKLPRFPGYQVPARGQIQLVLKNSNRTAFKPFLIPYDLTGLDRAGLGGRTFLRQKSYTVDEHDERGKLRFAVHLQFCSPPATPSKGKKAASAAEPKFYLYHAVRVVFASRGLDVSDKLRVVLEGPEELMYGSSAGMHDPAERFGAYSGPGKEWELARKKAKEREKMKADFPALSSAIDDDDGELNPADTADTTQQHDSLATFDTLSSSLFPALASSAAAPASPIPPPARVSSPSPPPAPASALAYPSPLPFLPPSAAAAVPASVEPLTFDRVPSPRPPFLDLRERKLSVSNLSASRPSSRNERAGSGERERCGR
ncbi:hypothetical protein JCM6882_005161 [Rhodosporidiobolus microsporus]